ncbi:MAG: MATE family efflux transporter [Candidatus Peribacteraceae bacterium]
MSNDHSPGTHDLTKGPIRPQLWALSWPMMLSVFFYTLYNIVDAYWVSKLSPESIAAVSISQISLFLMISLGFGITIGSGVVMSMDIGAKNKPEAERVLGQSFVLTFLAGIFFTIVALVFRHQLLTLSGATGAIYAPAMEYFVITAGGSVLFFILITIMFAFNAQGDTFTLTKLFALSTLINCVLDPILIFGWYGAPAMGIGGAAYATLISQAAFIVIAMRSLMSEKRSIRFHFKNLTMRWASVKKVLRIGIPASLTQLINPIGTAAMTWLAGHAFLEAGAIAFSLGFRIEFFAYLPAVGFGFGAMAMIGQNIGARNMTRAKEVLRIAFLLGGSIALVLGLLAAIFPTAIIGIFTTDPVVSGYALLYFRTVALSYGFLAIMMISASTFQALGKSWPGFWIAVLRFFVITIPIGYVTTIVLHHTILSLWLSLVAGNVVAAIVGYFWIQRTMNRFDFKEVEETVAVHV